MIKAAKAPGLRSAFEANREETREQVERLEEVFGRLDVKVQDVEHYEMAAYGTLMAWAHATGCAEAAALLQESFDEEKAADGKLSALAEAGINKKAADMSSDGDDSEVRAFALVVTGPRTRRGVARRLNHETRGRTR